MQITAIQFGRPSMPKRYMSPMLAEPMMKGIERSSPPRSTTRVWPRQASPRKAAKTSIDFMLMVEKKPSTTMEPTMKRPISAVMPMKALLFSAM